MSTIAELSKKMAPQLDQLQAIFPEWDDQDLVLALQDCKGNVEDTVLAISEGRLSQFTQATKKKPVKPAGSKSYGGRNADAGGWENAESFSGGGRGGRAGGRGGRGGAVARGMAAVRGARIGRGGARGGARGGYSNVNGAKKTDGPSDGWPTTTATTVDGWTSQVEQAEAASAHEDDGGWGETSTPEPSKPEETPAAAAVEAPKEVKEPVKRGAWGKELPKSAQPPKPAAAPAAPAPAAAASSSAPPAPAAAPAAPAPPAAPAKKTWAQIAKPIEKPKPAPPPPAPKAPEPQPEPTPAAEEPAKEEEEVVAEAEPEQVAEEKKEEVAEEVPEEKAAEPEPVVAEEEQPKPAAAEEPAAPAATEETWASDPAIVGSAGPAAAAPEPVTTYTGPPGFNTVASKAVGAQQPRTSSRGAHRFKNTGGEAVVLPAQASGVSSVEIQFGNLSFGGLNGDGVETPVQPEAEPAPAPAATSPIAHAPAAAPIAPTAVPQPAAAQPSAASSWQQAAPQQPAGYPAQAQAQTQAPSYESYGQQQQAQQPHQQETPQQQQPQQQQSQYGYRQDGYYNPIGTQAQQGQQAEQTPQQQAQQTQQQQQPQQHSYDQFGAGGFSNQGQWSGQQQPQHTEYGHGRSFDSFSNTGYPRPPVDEPKQQAPTPTAPAQPQQNLPHQQNQYYSALGNMGYYHHPSGPYNPYYQYGQSHNPGFQQYYPMAGRQLYGQPPAHQPPAPIPTNKPTPPTHSPYGAPNPYPSSGFDDQTYGLGRFGESNKASGNLQSGAQSQQTPQPIGAGSLPQSGYPSQQGLHHNFLGGGINTPTGSSGSQQPNRPQAGTPEDSFKGQGAGSQQSGAGAAGAGARGAQPQQPQAQQAFASYPYGGYQSHDWSPYGQQQHYGGSRNGGYTGGWQQ